MKYRICKYKDAYKDGYCAQVKWWGSLWFWHTIKDIYGDTYVVGTEKEAKRAVLEFENKTQITPLKQKD